MGKRQIVPKKFTLAVSGGVGSVALDFGLASSPVGRMTGHITYVVIIAGPTGAPTPKGKVSIADGDNSLDIYKDPKPGASDVLLDFYTYEMRVPVNGPYTLNLADVNRDGTYTALVVLEERPRVV